jgi:hypothetical protein
LQYRLTGPLSFSFLFLLVHATIFFWVVLFFMFSIAIAALVNETLAEKDKLETDSAVPD